MSGFDPDGLDPAVGTLSGCFQRLVVRPGLLVGNRRRRRATADDTFELDLHGFCSLRVQALNRYRGCGIGNDAVVTGGCRRVVAAVDPHAPAVSTVAGVVDGVVVEADLGCVTGIAWRTADTAVFLVVVQCDHQPAVVVGNRFVAGLTDRTGVRWIGWDLWHSLDYPDEWWARERCTAVIAGRDRTPCDRIANSIVVRVKIRFPEQRGVG